MIKVKRFPEYKVAHFDPMGKFLGMLNLRESVELRNQIAEQNASGYYIVVAGSQILIRPNGKFSKRNKIKTI